MQYLLGIDIGTSSVKVLSFTPKGQLLGRVSRSYTILQPTPDRSEQRPEEVFNGVIDALETAIAKNGGEPIGMSWGAAMHSFIPLDEHDRPLTPCLLWSDRRSLAQCHLLRQSSLGEEVARHSGSPIHPMLPICKIRWLREHQPEIFAKSARFVSLKEYIWKRLFGTFLVDWSTAAASGLFDHEEMDWYEPALEFAGIRRDQLSVPVPPSHTINSPPEDYPLLDCPSIIGSTDGCLANLGAGAKDENTLVASIGSSGALRITNPQPLKAAGGKLFSYPISRKSFVCGAPINNGGLAYRWFVEHIMSLDSKAAASLQEEAAALAPGADGLLFLPYLLGERAPHWNAGLRAAFFGLHLNHGPAHLLRAVMEGVIFSLFDSAQIMKERGIRPKAISANGGFVRSPLWVQILADVFGLPVQASEGGDEAAIGSAMLGLEALGKTDGWQAASDFSNTVRQYLPDADRHHRYQQIFQSYRRLFEQLLPLQD